MNKKLFFIKAVFYFSYIYIKIVPAPNHTKRTCIKHKHNNYKNKNRLQTVPSPSRAKHVSPREARATPNSKISPFFLPQHQNHRRQSGARSGGERSQRGGWRRSFFAYRIPVRDTHSSRRFWKNFSRYDDVEFIENVVCGCVCGDGDFGWVYLWTWSWSP